MEMAPGRNWKPLGSTAETILRTRSINHFSPPLPMAQRGVRSRPLTSTLYDPTQDGFGGSFIGDYYVSIWDGRSVYAVWPATTSGVSQDTIGGAQF